MDCKDCENYKPKNKVPQERIETLYSSFSKYCNPTDCNDCEFGDGAGGKCLVWKAWNKVGEFT